MIELEFVEGGIPENTEKTIGARRDSSHIYDLQISSPARHAALRA